MLDFLGGCSPRGCYVPKIQSLAEFLGTTAPDAGPEAPPSETMADFSKLTVKEFCRAVLTSPEYRQSIFNRVVSGDLPPAVECRMYDYAYGKPVEKVEVKNTTVNTLKDLDREQLVEELESLTNQLRESPGILLEDDDDRDAPKATFH